MSHSSHGSSPAFSLERVSILVSDLEQELALAPSDSPKLAALKAEIDSLKQTLAKPDQPVDGLHQHLKGTHSRLEEWIATVEGEALKDTPYLTEMARILGMI
jgi:capsule polysaccharide export protein KpsE/RkpR